MKITVGDIFESNAQTLINTVNTVGVMGKGIALQFKMRFPPMYADYVKRCEAGLVQLGRPYIYSTLFPPSIINFPTKGHWRAVSRLADIIEGLEYLEVHYKNWGVESLAVPPLGCGEGGLDWRIVGPTMYRHLSRLDIPVQLFAPFGTPSEQLETGFLSGQIPAAQGAPNVKAGWVALVAILAEILNQPLHWPVGRVTFQKLAYFASQAGIPTDLRFEKGSYGPYSSELKPLITRLVNNGLIEEQKLGRMFAVKPGPTYKDARAAFEPELGTMNAEFERVIDLVSRFATTDQAEVAASAHFVAQGLAARPGSSPTEGDVLDGVLHWKQRRRPPLDPADVAMAIRALGGMGWLNLQPTSNLPVPDDQLIGI